MAEKLKKMLNYWFNPENYSIVNSINSIIDTVNELIDGGGGGGGGGYTLPIATTTTLGGVKVDGSTITANEDGVISAIGSGGGSIVPLNWSKAGSSVSIPTPLPMGTSKFYQISSSNFGVSGTHKGIVIESDWFDNSGTLSTFPAESSINFSVQFSDNTSITSPMYKSTTDKNFNRIRCGVVLNPYTGLYEMSGLIATEQHTDIGGMTLKAVAEEHTVQSMLQPFTSIPIPSDLTITSIGITVNVSKLEGAFATENGATFSMYVAD